MGKTTNSGKTGPAFSYGEKGLRLARTWETFLILTEAAQPLTAADFGIALSAALVLLVGIEAAKAALRWQRARRGG